MARASWAGGAPCSNAFISTSMACVALESAVRDVSDSAHARNRRARDARTLDVGHLDDAIWSRHVWVSMDTLVRVDVCRFYCMCIGKRDNCIRMILIPFFGEQMAVGTDWANFQMETAFIRV